VSTSGIIAGIVILIVILITLPRFNVLHQLKNAVEEGQSNIGVQLTRRQRLITNIIRLVDAYTKYEMGTLSSIVDKRRGGLEGEEEAGYQLGSYALVALAEQYPKLRANETFIRLISELSDTEDKLAISRERLNEAIRIFNNERCTFPNLILLGWFFKKEVYFEFPPGAESPVLWPGPIAGYNHRG